MAQGTCSIEGCESLVRSRGWCRIHYERWRRTGDPLKLLKAWTSAAEVAASGVKWCPSCEQEKSLDAFRGRRRAGGRPQSYCSDCRRDQARARYRNDPEFRAQRKQYFRDFRAKSPETERRRQRAVRLRSNYGLTIDEYDALLRAQGGVCKICGGGPHGGAPNARKQWLSVDHCHETGRIRGLLCDKCNIGLGNFKDDPSLLRIAIEYLLHEAPASAA